MKFTRYLRKFLPLHVLPTRLWIFLTVALWLMLFVAIFQAFELRLSGFWRLLPVAFWLMVLVADVALLILLVGRRRRGKQRPEDQEAREAFARARRGSAISSWSSGAAPRTKAPDGGRWQVLERWRERLERLEEPALLRAWVEATGLSSPDDEAWARRSAAHWLRSLEFWGLTRYHPATVEINEQTLRRFHFHPRRGSGIAVVKSPSWSFNGVVVQKGHAVVESDHDA